MKFFQHFFIVILIAIIKEVLAQRNISKIICEDKSTTLVCDDTQVVSILYGIYGRENSFKQECVNRYLGTCYHEVKQKLGKICSCKSRCLVTANDQQFGDSCDLLREEYLRIIYTCVTDSSCSKTTPTSSGSIISSVPTSANESYFESSNETTFTTNYNKSNQTIKQASKDEKENIKSSKMNSGRYIWVIIGVILGFMVLLLGFIFFVLWKKNLCCKCSSKNELGDHIDNYQDDVFVEETPKRTMEKNEMYGSVENDYTFFGDFPTPLTSKPDLVKNDAYEMNY